jgi:flagellar basal body-associated protein FliL
MAEKAEKKPDAAPPAAKPAAAAEEKHDSGGKKGGGLLSKMPVLLGIVMILEAVVLFAGFKFLGAGAKPAAGAELTVPTTESSEGGKSDGGEGGEKGGAATDKKKTVVIKVTEFKAPNKKSGISFLYDLKICATTKGEYEKQVEDTITDKEPLIQDRIRTIIAQSDPEKLSGGSEPGLETLRRQIKYQLDEIVGDGMIDEVLVPRCIPFRTDY